MKAMNENEAKKGSRRQRRGRLAKGKQRHSRQRRGAITAGKVTVAQLSQGFNGYYGICEVGLNEALVSGKYISHRKSHSGCLIQRSPAAGLHYVASTPLIKFRIRLY